MANDLLIYYRLNRPPFFKNGHKYNNKTWANLTVEPDRIIYNFPALSNFYIYDFSDEKITEIKATSDYTAEESPPYIRGKYFPVTSLNYLHELFYKKIYFDQANSRYYALHFAKNNDTNERGIKSYLQIFSEDFKKIHEVQMDSDLKPVPIFIDNKILMRTMHSEKENIIEFIELTIK